jgi:hypothetical protein
MGNICQLTSVLSWVDMSISSDKIDDSTYITLAGGAIRCRRCLARSSRTGEQCRKPAMKSSRTQKCTHHGGRSKGATTAKGKQRIIDANLKHGECTLAERKRHSQISARLSMLEDCMIVLGMGDGLRIRGRKPAGYRPIRTMDEVKQFLVGID